MRTGRNLRSVPPHPAPLPWGEGESAVWFRRALTLLAATAVCFNFNASAKPPPAKAPAPVAAGAPILADLKVFPADINLSSKQDKQSLVVQATYSDGATRDVTDKASLTMKDNNVARLEKGT